MPDCASCFWAGKTQENKKRWKMGSPIIKTWFISATDTKVVTGFQKYFSKSTPCLSANRIWHRKGPACRKILRNSASRWGRGLVDCCVWSWEKPCIFSLLIFLNIKITRIVNLIFIIQIKCIWFRVAMWQSGLKRHLNKKYNKTPVCGRGWRSICFSLYARFPYALFWLNGKLVSIAIWNS